MQDADSLFIRKKHRYTIGFLDENVDDSFHSQLMRGIFEAARKFDVNIIRFGGFSPYAGRGALQKANMILDHIAQYDIDGLIFLAWSLAGAMYNYDEFMKRFGNIPLFCIGSTFDDIPGVYFAGDLYTKELLVHLIKEHQCRRIAYIPTYCMDGRNEIYIETMKEYGMYHPELYVDEKNIAGLDSGERAQKALSILIDERKAQFDAIVSMYVLETVEILNELKRRGFNIPEDIALASYEAGEYGRFSSPGITTIDFPWRDLGYKACEKLVDYLDTGCVEHSTEVKGRILYRKSCGCRPVSVRSITENNGLKTCRKLSDITDDEKKEIADALSGQFRNTGVDFGRLLDAFIKGYSAGDGRTEAGPTGAGPTGAGHGFLNVLSDELRSISYWMESSAEKDIITIFRQYLMPYLINEPDAMLWSGNIFQQAQVLTRDTIANMEIFEKSNQKSSYQLVQEIGRFFITKFDKDQLMDSLVNSLKLFNINSCRIFLFDEGGEHGLSDNYSLSFEYSGERSAIKAVNSSDDARRYLADMMSGNSRAVTLFAHLLHVQNDHIGFVLFEPGPLGERMYQIITSYISTALNGSILLGKLDAAYRRLVEQAQREGMAEVASEILHGIGNTLNSMNASATMMRKLATNSVFMDLESVNDMLENNLGDLTGFFSNDGRSKKLMKFILQISLPLLELQQKLLYHAWRLNEKVNEVNAIIISQQRYAGVDTCFETLNIASVLEDVIRLHSISIEKYGIRILKDFRSSVKVSFQKIKLFHVFLSLINNAIEALKDTPPDERSLKLSIYEDEDGIYAEVADNGCGMTQSQLERIFLNGYSTKEDRRGMGLSSCKSYMEEMGGAITARSRGAGLGASFMLKFRKEIG